MKCTTYTLLCMSVVILGTVECSLKKNDRQINFALETVVNFHKKDRNSDVMLINNVQKFLKKLKKAISSPAMEVDETKLRRSPYISKSALSLSDLLQRLILVLLKYEDDDIEVLSRMLSEEMRQYHYQGCKFHELTEIPAFKSWMSLKLDELAVAQPKYVKKKLNELLHTLQKEDFSAGGKEMLEFVDTLYDKDAKNQWKEIIKSLDNYRSKSKRTSIKLKDIVKQSIRDNLFDHYTHLKINTRRQLRIKLHAVLKNLPTTHKIKRMDEIRTEEPDIEKSPVDYFKDNPVGLAHLLLSKLKSAVPIIKKVIYDTSATSETDSPVTKRHKKSTSKTSRKVKTKKSKHSTTEDPEAEGSKMSITVSTSETSTRKVKTKNTKHSTTEYPDESPSPTSESTSEMTTRKAKTKKMKRTTTEDPEESNSDWEIPNTSPKPFETKVQSDSEEATKQKNLKSRKKTKKDKKTKKKVITSSSREDEYFSKLSTTTREEAKTKNKVLGKIEITLHTTTDDRDVGSTKPEAKKKKHTTEHDKSIVSEFKEATTKRREKYSKKEVTENIATGFSLKGFKKRYSKKSNLLRTGSTDEKANQKSEGRSKPKAMMNHGRLLLQSFDINLEYKNNNDRRGNMEAARSTDNTARNETVMKFRNNVDAIEQLPVTTEAEEGLSIGDYETSVENGGVASTENPTRLPPKHESTLTPPQSTTTETTTKVANDEENLIAPDNDKSRRAINTNNLVVNYTDNNLYSTQKVNEKPSQIPNVVKKIQSTSTLQTKIETVTTPTIPNTTVTATKTTETTTKTTTTNVKDITVTANETKANVVTSTVTEKPEPKSQTSTDQFNEFEGKDFDKILQQDRATAGSNATAVQENYKVNFGIEKDPFGDLESLATMTTEVEPVTTVKPDGILSGDPLADIYDGFV